MNIHKAISSGMKILEDNFILTAGLDSEILMAQAIRKNRKYILLNPNEKVNLKDLENFKLLIKNKRAARGIVFGTIDSFSEPSCSGERQRTRRRQKRGRGRERVQGLGFSVGFRVVVNGLGFNLGFI